MISPVLIPSSFTEPFVWRKVDAHCVFISLYKKVIRLKCRTSFSLLVCFLPAPSTNIFRSFSFLLFYYPPTSIFFYGPPSKETSEGKKREGTGGCHMLQWSWPISTSMASPHLSGWSLSPGFGLRCGTAQPWGKERAWSKKSIWIFRRPLLGPGQASW